jgi:hypothetical protein
MGFQQIFKGGLYNHSSMENGRQEPTHYPGADFSF